MKLPSAIEAAIAKASAPYVLASNDVYSSNFFRWFTTRVAPKNDIGFLVAYSFLWDLDKKGDTESIDVIVRLYITEAFRKDVVHMAQALAKSKS